MILVPKFVLIFNHIYSRCNTIGVRPSEIGDEGGIVYVEPYLPKEN